MTSRASLSPLLLALAALVACDGPVATPDAGPPPLDPLRADCESLVPEYCALPFPSDYWLIDDSSTASGRRVNLGPTSLPRSRVRPQHIEPGPFNTRDGFSVNATQLAYLPGATAAGLPNPDNIADSLDPASPTVLLNAATGERVAHFSEIDESVRYEESDRTFFVRAVVPLEHETRYIVAIRGVVDASGAEVAPSETFASLRDATESDVATIEARRDHFEDIFTILGDNGVARDDLQLAWDFTTSSQADDTGWLIAARDKALAAVGDAGPDFRIDSIEEFTEAENANVARRVRGTMIVPLFLDNTDAETSRLVLGADGLPEQNGTGEFPFIVNVPRSATPDTPVRPIQYGHGLLGSRLQANAGWLSEFGNINGFMPFGVDWVGMAEEDFPPLTRALSTGQLHDFQRIPERLVQGIINSLMAMRLMLSGFGEHPDMLVGGRSVVDTTLPGFYTGDSQGGIFGGTYMSLTTDVERGILGVPGQPYHILLNRSVDFDPYLSLLRQSYDDGPGIQIGIALMQLLWDRTEPGSFTRHIMDDNFADTPRHQVILQVAMGDQQVTTLGAHIMARSIGAVAIVPQTRPMWDIEEIDGPHLGSAIVEWDFGNVPDPITNVPPRVGDDPHGFVRRHPAALAQTLHFFETGEIIHTCDGPCDPD